MGKSLKRRGSNTSLEKMFSSICFWEKKETRSLWKSFFQEKKREETRRKASGFCQNRFVLWFPVSTGCGGDTSYTMKREASSVKTNAINFLRIREDDVDIVINAVYHADSCRRPFETECLANSFSKWINHKSYAFLVMFYSSSTLFHLIHTIDINVKRHSFPSEVTKKKIILRHLFTFTVWLWTSFLGIHWSTFVLFESLWLELHQ